MVENLSEREASILHVIVENPRISVAELATIEKVSEVSIRNCLKELENKGLFVRAHGGGMPAFHPMWSARLSGHRDVKMRLAKATAELIRSGDDLMLIGGTTTTNIVRFLYGRRDVKIVTNSTALLPYARTNTGIRFLFTGGEFRPEIEEMVGPTTIRELKQFHVGTAFLGTDGLIPKKGLTADTVEIAEIRKAGVNLIIVPSK